jgi:hypothetical protein
MTKGQVVRIAYAFALDLYPRPGRYQRRLRPRINAPGMSNASMYTLCVPDMDFRRVLWESSDKMQAHLDFIHQEKYMTSTIFVATSISQMANITEKGQYWPQLVLVATERYSSP